MTRSQIQTALQAFLRLRAIEFDADNIGQLRTSGRRQRDFERVAGIVVIQGGVVAGQHDARRLGDAAERESDVSRGKKVLRVSAAIFKLWQSKEVAG